MSRKSHNMSRTPFFSSKSLIFYFSVLLTLQAGLELESSSWYLEFTARNPESKTFLVFDMSTS